VARTIADLAGADAIGREHLLEAIQHRRYGDADIYWSYS
jgi:predicted ATPase with chaperone activity